MDTTAAAVGAIISSLQGVALYILHDLRKRIERLEDLYIRNGNPPRPTPQTPTDQR